MSVPAARIVFVTLGWLGSTLAAVAQGNEIMPLADVWITSDRATPYLPYSGEAPGPVMSQTGDTWLTEERRTTQPPAPARQDTAARDPVRTGSTK